MVGGEVGGRMTLEFELFDRVALAKGETQIRTAGLRISSYATDSEGIPVMTASSRERLYSSLLAKVAFDSGRHSIDEPESEHLRLEPTVIRRPQVMEPQTLEPPEPIAVTVSRPAPEQNIEAGRTCQQCGQPFPAKRRDAKLCSPACRKRASREMKSAGSTQSCPDSLGNPVRTAVSAGF
jgi:hypothetical protein